MYLLILLLALIGPNDDPPSLPEIPADPLAKGIKPMYRERFLQGLGEAETFRRELVRRDLRGRTTARLLGEAVVRFRERAAPGLAGRPGVGGFAITPEVFEARIRGDGHDVDPAATFGAFEGRWYGLWRNNPVDHDWSRVMTHNPPATGAGLGELQLLATQSAWVGDGFGWNAVAATGRSRGSFILGTVYHVEGADPDRIRLHRPHVGIEVGTGRLIWITSREVFLEEVLPSSLPGKARYAITGFRYTRREEKIEIDGEAYQAVYGRDPAHRPAWHSFPISLAEDRKPERSQNTPSEGGLR